jgi:amino acid transporter
MTLVKAHPPAAPRVMGIWALAAVGLNSTIGAGFYLLPATYFNEVGAWAPLVLLVVGMLMFAIAMCFAEVGSRFSSNGGAYLYVRAAFGPFAGFQIGWLLYLSRVISTASMFAALMLLLEVVTGAPLSSIVKAAVIVSLTTVISIFSIIGGRANASLVTGLAVIKVAPVLVLLAFFAPHADWTRLAPETGLSAAGLGAAVVTAMFSYAGFENLAIPAAEASDPRRDIPRALAVALTTAIVLLVGANAAAISLVPDLGNSPLALADAARVVFGPAGWWMIAGTAILAVAGSKAGSLLANSRLLHGLSEQGDIPAVFGALSERYGTPFIAVIVSAALTAGLAMTGTFAGLVVLAVGTRVLVYAGVALAAWRLRLADRTDACPQARFRMPAAPAMITLVLAGCGVILMQMKEAQFFAIAAGLGSGLVLFGARRLMRRALSG